MKKILFLLCMVTGFTMNHFTLSMSSNNKFEILEFNLDEVKNVARSQNLGKENISEASVQPMQRLLTLSPNNKKTNDMILICKSRADQKLAGYLDYFINPGCNYATVNIIGTESDYQRQGVASLLLQKVQENCAKQNIRNLRLCVASNNDVAIACYKKAGFYRSWECKLADLLIAWKELTPYRKDFITMAKKIA